MKRKRICIVLGMIALSLLGGILGDLFVEKMGPAKDEIRYVVPKGHWMYDKGGVLVEKTSFVEKFGGNFPFQNKILLNGEYLRLEYPSSNGIYLLPTYKKEFIISNRDIRRVSNFFTATTISFFIIAIYLSVDFLISPK